MAGVSMRRLRGNVLFHDKSNRKSILDAYGQDVVKYSDDFLNSGLAAANAPLGYTVTLVGTSTITKADAVGGAIILTTGGTENNGVTMQLAGESFGFAVATTYLTYFGIRLQISNATESDFIVGLCITDTDLLAGMTDGVYFRKVDGSTALACVTETGSAETETTGVHTMVAATNVNLEFYFDGTSTVFFVNGTAVATHTAGHPTTELVTPSVEFLTGSGNARTMQIDWIRAFQVGR